MFVQSVFSISVAWLPKKPFTFDRQVPFIFLKKKNALLFDKQATILMTTAVMYNHRGIGGVKVLQKKEK